VICQPDPDSEIHDDTLLAFTRIADDSKTTVATCLNF